MEHRRLAFHSPLDQARSVRHWLFSSGGALLAWGLVAVEGAVLWRVIIGTQNDVTRGMLVVLGIWWLLAVVVIQWCVPEGSDEDRPAEGLAGAGWQAALTLLGTGLAVWHTLFEGGEYVNRGLGGGIPALGAWFGCSVGSGLLVLWLRGHSILRVLGYGALGTVAGTGWMFVGLVLAAG